MIPPKASGEFVAAMEQVLDVYSRPYDEGHPVVCMDETPRQLIRQVREPLDPRDGTGASRARGLRVRARWHLQRLRSL